MAFRATAVQQTENLCSDIGKYGGGASKADRPKIAKNGRQLRRPFADLSNIDHQNRKPLRDVSNTRKFPATGPSKDSVLIDSSDSRARGTTKKVSKSKILTDEEIKICHEWAKEGIELVHFTGNDLQKVQKNAEETRVKKKLENVMAAVHEWSDMTCDLVLPVKKEVFKDDFIDVEEMEIEEEILPKSMSTSGSKDDLLGEAEVHILPLPDSAVELKMKCDYCSTTIDTASCPSACLE